MAASWSHLKQEINRINMHGSDNGITEMLLMVILDISDNNDRLTVVGLDSYVPWRQ